MSRKKPNKDTHDRKVKEIARQLKQEGYDVEADVSGYQTPEGIGKGGHIPDVLATKGKETLIVEVDTPGTEDTDQLSTFRRSASQREEAEFQHIITKPKKK